MAYAVVQAGGRLSGRVSRIRLAAMVIEMKVFRRKSQGEEMNLGALQREIASPAVLRVDSGEGKLLAHRRLEVGLCLHFSVRMRTSCVPRNAGKQSMNGGFDICRTCPIFFVLAASHHAHSHKRTGKNVLYSSIAEAQKPYTQIDR